MKPFLFYIGANIVGYLLMPDGAWWQRTLSAVVFVTAGMAWARWNLLEVMRELKRMSTTHG